MRSCVFAPAYTHKFIREAHILNIKDILKDLRRKRKAEEAAKQRDENKSNAHKKNT